MSLGQLRAGLAVAAGQGVLAMTFPIPQPKLQGTEDEPMLLQPAHQLISGLVTNPCTALQGPRAWRSLGVGTSVMLPPKILHPEHSASLGTVGAAAASPSAPSLSSACTHTEPSASPGTPHPPTEQLHGQGGAALQGRGRFVAEQWQTWRQGVAKGAPRLPKLCCTAQSGLPLCHSCLNSDGSARMSDPDLNIARAREITVMLDKWFQWLIAFTAEIWALFLS